MKCFILCRQSVGQNDPDESLSIDVQEQECLKFAASKNITVVDVFKESNTSGRLFPEGYEQLAAVDAVYNKWCNETKKTGQFRSQLGKLLKRLNEIDCIVCYDITRLHRSLQGSFLENLIIQELTANHIKVLTIKEGELDFNRFTDSLVTSLTSQINSEQLKTQIEKSKAAYKRLINAGEYYASVSKLKGYAPTGRKKEVVIVPREAEMICFIFKSFLDGMSLNDITKRVNVDFHDVYSNNPLHREVLNRILKNPAYCGYMRNTSGELIKSKQLEGKEIVSVETWMNVQTKIEKRKWGNAKPQKRWLPLSTIMYCGLCGRKIVQHGGWGGSLSFYTCKRHLTDDKEPCRINITVSNDRQEGCGLHETIKPLLLAEAMKEMNANKEDENTKKEVEKIDLALAEIKKKSKKLTDLWMQGLIDEDVYESSVKELKSKEAELSKDKTRFELSMSRDTSQFDWAKLMMKFRGDALTNEEYERLANVMLKKILVYRDSIEVKTVYGDIRIPRQKIGKYNLCYNYQLEIKNRKAAVYYYRGKALGHSKDATYHKAGFLNELEIFIED